ncbi:ABC transporter-like protein [Periconia macrospinosa]|uniref:ABC transporter-like protein n=1 Tax=Periconia macrospinosa TaxID=97972 RepID=A0A2V1DYE8_9PLEO|nr:ABC transporter-like protein [Periconia macrospinosa]
MIYIFAARLVLGYVAVIGFRHTGLRTSAAMRLKYLRSLMTLPVSQIDAVPQGHTAVVITITANLVQDGISEKLCLLIQNVSLVISAIIVAFVFSWFLAIVTISGLGFVLLVYTFSIYFITKRWNLVAEADKEGVGTASEALSSIRMVAACGAEDKVTETYGKSVKKAAKHGQKMSIWIALQSSLGKTAALCFWWAVQLYMRQIIADVQVLLVVITSIMTIVMSVGSISAPLGAVSRAVGAAAIFYTVIDAPKAESKGLKAPEVSATDDIVLNKVNYTYMARPQDRVLHNISVTFKAGKTTALVGPSGSGKSTIVALLERWFQLSVTDDEEDYHNMLRNGTITVAGHNIEEFDLKWWRSQIGLVQQEPFLFNGTIFENVSYGLIGTKWENETEVKKRQLVVEACKDAFAHDFISRMPNGYDTLCGDAGIHLSGGQRQRIAIARCIIKKPTILILDEATSAIDVRSERIVQEALDQATKGRTTIIIAHRLSTIQRADNIIVLKNGIVSQQGTHDKLMKNRAGLYHRLVKAQVLTEHDESQDTETIDTSIALTETSNAKEEPDWSTTDDSEHPSKSLKPKTFSRLRQIIRTLMEISSEQKSNWYLYVMILFGAAGAGAAFPLQAYLFANLISLFAFYGELLRAATNFWCLMTVILAIGVGLCHFVLGWACNTVSFVSHAFRNGKHCTDGLQRIIASYRHEYFQNILKRPIEFFDEKDNSTGALSARIANDPAQVQQVLGVNAASIMTCVFNVAGCVAISFYFSWRLSVVVVFSTTPVMLIAGFMRVRYERKLEKMTWLVFSESSKFAIECIGAFRTVSALTMEDNICNRYDQLLCKHVNDALWSSIGSTAVFAFSDSVSLLCMAFALWYGGNLLSEYKLWPFDYLVVYLAIVQGSLAAGQWLSFGANIAQAMSAAERIRGMRPEHDRDGNALSLEESEHETLPGPHSEDEKSVKGPKLELRNVWFKYPTRDVPVLRGLSMTARQFAAIVGPSGCGKTSIISLLERFYTPQFGEILMDEKSIHSLNLEKYRRNLSIVAQEPSIIAGTLRDNITMGVADPTTVTEDDLDRVCTSAELYDYIVSLPITYNTLVGQKGIALSGGQKQRLSIARALIRDPRLMLLDEATSNLDSETEKSIQKIFEETGKGRTMIVIAHRLATIQNADVIFVMSEGEVVEKGTHRELLRKRGTYWQMCQMQALNS